MLFITYQCQDYKEYKNPRYSDFKKLIGISEDENIYWCIKANNAYQAIINSFTISPNQPYYLVMFETEEYYEIDAIKWNYFVEKDISANKDLFNLEHENEIEYIVTKIPEKRFEIPIILPNCLEYLKNNIKTQSEGLQCLMLMMMENSQMLNNIISQEEIEYLAKDLYKNGEYSKQIDNTAYPYELVLMKIYYYYFISYYLPLVYLAGRVEIYGWQNEVFYRLPFNIRPWNEMYNLCNDYHFIFSDIKDQDDLNTKIQNYKKMLYKKFFTPIKEPYPNDACPCGSGKKYKKCCFIIDKKLKDLLEE